MELMRSRIAQHGAFNHEEEGFEEKIKRMELLETPAERKRVWKRRISRLEREQQARLRVQEYRNEQKKKGLSEEPGLQEEGERECQEERERVVHEKTADSTRIRYPTPREFSAALSRVRYRIENFHLAITGTSGCGKSSLINSFLNLNPNDAGAAPTGVTETTLQMGRYPDPGTQPPRPWTVWYDIPGAGTQRVSDSEYFTSQALFVFDVIIVVIGNRVMQTDCQIIRSCVQFDIPFFIVRSKSDMEIMNMMRDEDEGYAGPFNSGELYVRCRNRFRERSQMMITDELRRATLPNQTLYCVSNRALRNVYTAFLSQSINMDDDSHEMALVKELITIAYQRRGGGGITTEKTDMNMLEVSQTNVLAYVRLTDTNIRIMPM